MLSVVDLKFNNEKHFKKEKVIYHKGNVIGRPKTASRPLLIPRIKKVQIQHRKNEQKNTLTEEEEEKHLLGNILKDAFTASELNHINDIDPNPRVNRTKKKKEQMEKEEEERKKHIKPYIPQFMTEALSADNTGNVERELKRTINLFENNEALENKVKMLIKESKVLKMFNEKKSEQPVKVSAQFVPIVDIIEDKKYQQANEDMKRYKEQCESLKKKTIDVNQTLKQNAKKDIGIDNKISSKQQNDINAKAQKIIDNIKTNVDVNNFDINSLNERDRKLLLGASRYQPQRRKTQKVNHTQLKNDELLLKSINSLIALKDTQSKIKTELSQQLNIDFKEEIIKDSLKIDDMLSTSYSNNFNKGKRLSYGALKNKTNKEVNRKEDFFDYMYFKDDEQSTTYSHPFLIYD